MSTPEPAGRPGTIGCPRCGQPILPEQDWCLVCGAAARTRLAPTPNWRAPVATLAAVVVLSVAALIGAFVVLTDDPGPGSGTTGASGPSGPTAPAAPAPALAPAPAPTGPTGPTDAQTTSPPATAATGATGAGG